LHKISNDGMFHLLPTFRKRSKDIYRISPEARHGELWASVVPRDGNGFKPAGFCHPKPMTVNINYARE
jgi:hypothetical protein